MGLSVQPVEIDSETLGRVGVKVRVRLLCGC